MATHNLKVGFAVIIGIAILVAAFSFVGGERFTKKNTYRLNVVFENVQGLVPGAKVWLSGVEIGKVENVTLRADGKATLGLIIGKQFKIVKGAEFSIKVGFLKDTILSIKNPDIMPSKAQFYADNDTITKTSSPATIDDLVASANHALGNVNDMLMSVKQIVGDENMKQNIFETMKNINKTTDQAYEFAKILKETGLENRPDIKAAMDNIRILTAQLNVNATQLTALLDHADGVMNNVNGVVANANTLIANANDVAGDPQFKAEVKQSVSSLNSTLASFDATAKSMKDMLTDTGMQSDLRETVKNTRITMEGASGLVANANTLVSNANDVTSDPQFKSEIKQAVTNLNSTLANLDEATKALKDLITDTKLQDDIKGAVKSTRTTMANADIAVQGLSKAVREINETKIKPSFEFRRNVKENKFHADMNLRLYPPDPEVYYMLGFDDIGENSGTNLMLGVLGDAKDLWYRFGIKSGKLGIGADYDKGNTFYEADIVDPNDLRGSLRVGKRLSGNTYLMGGWEGAFSDNDFSAGLLQKY